MAPPRSQGRIEGYIEHRVRPEGVEQPGELKRVEVKLQQGAVDGGRALSSTLVSVLITDDGRVFAGAVPVERLQAAAAQE